MFGGNPLTDAMSATPEAKAFYAVVVVFVILGLIYLYRLFWSKTCPMPKISMPWSSKDKMMSYANEPEQHMLGMDGAGRPPHM